MSAKPPNNLDAAALQQALGGRAPAALTREGRIALIGEVGKALLDGRSPSREACMFVGGALLGWLEQGGDLARDFLKVVKAKSHNTPARIWAAQVPHPDEGAEPDGNE
jgi:hypothetical protein